MSRRLLVLSESLTRRGFAQDVSATDRQQHQIDQICYCAVLLAQVTTANHVASRTLADEVKRKVRDQELLLWLDSGRHYEALGVALQKGDHDFPHSVVVFRGRHRVAMLELERYKNDLRSEQVLIHLSGLNKETIYNSSTRRLASGDGGGLSA